MSALLPHVIPEEFPFVMLLPTFLWSPQTFQHQLWPLHQVSPSLKIKQQAVEENEIKQQERGSIEIKLMQTFGV